MEVEKNASYKLWKQIIVLLTARTNDGSLIWKLTEPLTFSELITLKRHSSSYKWSIETRYELFNNLQAKVGHDQTFILSNYGLALVKIKFDLITHCRRFKRVPDTNSLIKINEVFFDELNFKNKTNNLLESVNTSINNMNIEKATLLEKKIKNELDKENHYQYYVHADICYTDGKVDLLRNLNLKDFILSKESLHILSKDKKLSSDDLKKNWVKSISLVDINETNVFKKDMNITDIKEIKIGRGEVKTIKRFLNKVTKLSEYFKEESKWNG